MGQALLVEDYIQSGKDYLKQLAAAGFDFTVAFWAKQPDSYWYLYIATPIVDEKGPRGGYTELGEVTDTLNDVWINPLDVRLVSPSDTMAVAAAEVIRPKPGMGPFGGKTPKHYPGMTPFGGSSFGGVEVEGVLIYPPVAAATP